VLPVAFDARQHDVLIYGDKTGPLDTDGSSIGVCVSGDKTHTLTKSDGATEDGTGRGTPIVAQGLSVRRLTPTECERLQGFPDGWTAIPWKGKPASECPDGPRYKALGNSMAVNCMRWIGARIQAVEEA
jgi:DNA (cytosine-5)-methyltransferase 1